MRPKKIIDLVQKKTLPKNRWTLVTLKVQPDQVDIVEETFFQEGAISIDLKDAFEGEVRESPVYEKIEDGNRLPWRRVVFSAIFPFEKNIASRLDGVLSHLGINKLSIIQGKSFVDRDWVAVTQEQFPVTRIDDRLVVTPSWKSPLFKHSEDVVALTIDPGGAFGTGSHVTTRLCLKWMADNPPTNKCVIDYGCGSGILAIAAKKLGAAKVIAIEIDDEALLVAKQNAENNQVDIAIRDGKEEISLSCDLLMANILANPLIILAPLFASMIIAGGKIILSGILTEQKKSVIDAFSSFFNILYVREEGGWILLEGERIKGQP